MNILRQLIGFLVYSNTWIGLGAAAMTWKFYLITDLHIRYDIIAFNFFATILTYTFQRYIKIKKGTHGEGNRLDWMTKNGRLVLVSMVVMTVACVLILFKLTVNSYLLLLFCGLLSLFYVVEIPIGKRQNLRDIPSLKIYLIAIVWALTTTFLPYLNRGEESNELPLLALLANFIFIVAITIPFDIRDVKLDEDEKKTIPQRIGVRKATILAMTLLGVNFFINPGGLGIMTFPNFVFVVVSMAVVWQAQKKEKDLFFSFWVDGLLIFQALCLFTQYLSFKALI